MNKIEWNEDMAATRGKKHMANGIRNHWSAKQPNQFTHHLMTKNRIPMITHHIDFFFTFRISILFIEKLNCKSGTYNTFRPNSFSNGLMLAFLAFFCCLHSSTSENDVFFAFTINPSSWNFISISSEIQSIAQ